MCQIKNMGNALSLSNHDANWHACLLCQSGQDPYLSLIPDFVFLLIKALGSRGDGSCSWGLATHVEDPHCFPGSTLQLDSALAVVGVRGVNECIGINPSQSICLLFSLYFSPWFSNTKINKKNLQNIWIDNGYLHILE